MPAPFGGSTKPKPAAPAAPVAPRGPGSAGYASPWLPNQSGGRGAANPNFQEELSQANYAAQQQMAAARPVPTPTAADDLHDYRLRTQIDDDRARTAAADTRATTQADTADILKQLGPPPGAPGAGPAVPVAPPVPGAAEGAEFARAKDRIGQLLGGGMKALKNSFAARGLAGSGLEAAGMTDLVEGSQGDLGEVIRDQAIEGERRGQQVEDRNYAGAQRTRDQDIDIWNSRAQMLMNLLARRGGSLY